MIADADILEKEPVHLGRNVGRIREMVGMKQITLAEKTGMSQQNISKLEQSEKIPDDTLEKIAKGLGVSIEFIKTFNEEKAIYNIQNNNTFNDHAANSSQHYKPTFNNTGIDKLTEMLQRLLELEQRKIEVLEQRIEALEKRH
jgi:transcriptional regulator with XRE-family HTH domain